jgi:hypothetical protein
MKWSFSEQINPHFCERQFFIEVMNKLSHLDDSFNFIITNYDDYTLPLFNKEKKNIILYLSDEYGIYRNWFNKADLIFRTYPRKGNYDNKKIFPIPCGLVMPDYVKYKMEQPKKKLEDRKYDFFYSGQLSPNRVQFVKKVTEATKDYNGILRNTQNFRTGYSIDEYFEIMNETKISFVPLGKVIPESFRYMESFESGCVVITDFPIDDYKDIWYYKESPAIFIKDYEEINDFLLDNALANIDFLEQDNLNYYNNFLSTTAVSKYITDTIKEKNL